MSALTLFPEVNNSTREVHLWS